MEKEDVYIALANALTFINDTVAEANGRPLGDFLEYHNVIEIVREEIDFIWRKKYGGENDGKPEQKV